LEGKDIRVLNENFGAFDFISSIVAKEEDIPLSKKREDNGDEKGRRQRREAPARCLAHGGSGKKNSSYF
jgi:hypothetical protein